MPATLFHHPAACSCAARYAAAIGQTPLDVAFVNIFDKSIEGGGSLFDVNPLGQVSTLRLEDGRVLAESASVLMWIQDHAENQAFRREPGSGEWYSLLRWISFVGTELHKSVCWPLMHQHVHEAEKEAARVRGYERLALLDAELSDRAYLLGDEVSAADLYLFWALGLMPVVKISIEPFMNLAAHVRRVGENPLVGALRDEDLVKAAEMAPKITDWTPARNPVLMESASEAREAISQ